jgi:hypothetical protein
MSVGDAIGVMVSLGKTGENGAQPATRIVSVPHTTITSRWR